MIRIKYVFNYGKICYKGIFQLLALFCFVLVSQNAWCKQIENEFFITYDNYIVYKENAINSKASAVQLSERFLYSYETAFTAMKPSHNWEHYQTEQESNIFSINRSILPCQQPGVSRNSYKENVGKACYRFKDQCVSDFKNMHSRDSLCNFGLALMGGAVLANTKMDRNFTSWYQRHVRCDFTDDFSEFTKIFGEGKIFIPIAVTSAFVYKFWQEDTGKINERCKVGDFFTRTARGYATGTPMLLVFQYVAGGNRPRHGSSYWKPFQENHGVSGHAYIGAIPFLTAAEMCDRFWTKGIFYTLSIIPAWSRVNDNAHYLSQSILGWYLAYLSVRAVSATEKTKPWVKGLTIFPVTEENFVGIGFHLRY